MLSPTSLTGARFGTGVRTGTGGYSEYIQEGMVKEGQASPAGLEVVKGSGVRADGPEYPQGEPGCRLVPWARHPRPRAFASLEPGCWTPAGAICTPGELSA